MIKIKKDKKIEMKEEQSFDCGCIVEAEVIEHKEESKYHKVQYNLKKWTLKTPCSTHKANFMKKANKFLHKKEVLEKRNKRNDFEFKARVAKRRS